MFKKKKNRTRFFFLQENTTSDTPTKAENHLVDETNKISPPLPVINVQNIYKKHLF